MIQVNDVKNVLIIGCGTLGLRIGLRCAMDGYNVRMYDLSDDFLEKAVKTQGKLLASMVKKGQITEGVAAESKARITTTTDKKAAVKDIHLVSESVTEDLEMKIKMYQEFSQLFENQTVVTTNTSYLLASQLAEATGCAERFCAFHFHDVFVMNVVDIMPHPTTDPKICDLLMAFGHKIHQIPVFIKTENHGYVFNQMLLALLGSAGDLFTREITTIQDIDRSWMGNTKMNIGPFGIMDQIGLDTAWHVVSIRKDSRSVRFAELLRGYMEQGKLGLKTGEGFYKYPNPEYHNADFI